MPIKTKVYLYPEKPISSKILNPEAVHGVFFSTISEKLAEELHKPSRTKPFSLWFPQFFKGEKTLEKIYLEISFLKEELFPQFLSSYVLENKEISLNGVKLKKVFNPNIKEEYVKSYKAIFESAKGENTIVLDFMTPTTFKRGDFDHPLPDPKLVFKSLIRKWIKFSDYPLDLDLREIVENKIFVSGAWIKTVKVDLGKNAKITGFTGRVVFYVDCEDKKILKWLNALAYFGEFSGIGRKTTMGFGKVRLVLNAS